ncbi:sensor histidine kinase [Deinococcus sedimenti]|uniref:histidine kinase n=1 Tax=Deinococcus sedimenti TaxID=1867090 RepID=A0ABQ2S394_9DEIO|nr:ATP-binding protein [Deinococcus sedimenti]GGR92303.1 hypothetical protein GCM10008960_18940 [Deinococcus sedimenti]
MTNDRAPADAWLELTLALTQTQSLHEVQALLAGPLARHAGLDAALVLGTTPDGVPLPGPDGQPATLHLGRTPAREAQALTRLLSWHLTALSGADDTLRAFLQVTERLGSEIEFGALNLLMDQVLRELLPGLTVSVLERAERSWTIRFISDVATTALRVPQPDGLAAEVPLLRQAERSRGPVFVEDWNAQEQLVPASDAYRIAAAQAFDLPEWPRTVLTAGCTARRHWSAQDRALFSGAARAYGHALDRVASAQQLALERATLRALVEFKERAAHSMNVGDLAGQAAQVLRDMLDRLTVGYLVPDGTRWRAEVLQGDLPDRLAQQLRAGVPMQDADTREALQGGHAMFLPLQSAALEHVPGMDAFGAVALHPMLVNGQLTGLLAMATNRAPDWTERERSVFRTVGRSLAQAVEREARERRLARQHAELQAQARSLQAFAQLSADLGVQEDRYALIRRAQEVALSLLPAGFAVYYEPDGELWRLRSQVGSLRDDLLQQQVDRGLPLDSARNLTTPWQSGAPYYQDQYDPDTDHLARAGAVVGASATVPVRQGGVPVGVFAIGQYEPHVWTPADRALIEGVTRSLQLALDRAASLAELRRTSQDTARSNAALQAANEELEAFAYSVSHDLRAPVRHISGFTDLLRKSLGDLSGTPKAERYLTIITESAGQMNALIDAMLALSRVTRQELHLRDVDLNEVVAGVQATLGPELAGRDVTFRVAELPTVQVDAALIRQVMTNLLSNAVKYTERQPDALIEVWAQGTPDEWQVFVRDNGVGFDPAYAHKLFGVFQRLHRAEEFGGTGVGLANVRRIIQRHGGTIQAEGRPGAGATFWFSLPRTS